MSNGFWLWDFCVTEQAFSEFMINKETTNHTMSYSSAFLMKIEFEKHILLIHILSIE